MSIASEITALNTNLTAAKNAVTAKGGTVGNTGLAGLANEIAGIPSGGGGTVPASPQGVYAEVQACHIKYVVSEIYYPWQDNSLPPVSIDPLQFRDSVQGIIEQNINSFNNWYGESGNLCNFVFQYDGSQWNLYYFSDPMGTLDNITNLEPSFDIENAGFFYDSNLTYDQGTYMELLLEVEIDADDLSNIQWIPILSSGELNTLLYSVNDNSVYANEGLSFPSLIHSVQSPFDYGTFDVRYITKINFGTLATFTSLDDYALYGRPMLTEVFNLPNITSIGDYFMNFCISFNSTLNLSSVTSIGNGFLGECYSFNQPLNLPNVVSIGYNFLVECYMFNQPFTIPSSATSIGESFFRDCYAMISTITCEAPATVATINGDTLATYNNAAPCYTTGITLAGTYASDWKTRFPDSSNNPYRKLILGS